MVGFTATRGVKYSVVGVTVISPGPFELVAGKAMEKIRPWSFGGERIELTECLYWCGRIVALDTRSRCTTSSSLLYHQYTNTTVPKVEV